MLNIGVFVESLNFVSPTVFIFGCSTEFFEIKAILLVTPIPRAHLNI
jgi:hypothetical protein